MREVYRQTKLLLMPSSYESWGRVAVEAAASGIPTLAAATPGLLEALGDAGTFIDTPMEFHEHWQDPSKDVDAWERGLRRLLAPRPYGQARKATIARSAEIERERLAEREAWVAAVEDLAKLRGNRGLRNG
jgi:glycosyltransferase involved in cell wall biosynthesis